MCAKTTEPKFLEPDLAQQIVRKIRLYLNTIEKEEVDKLKNLIVELIKEYDDFDEKRSLKEVLRDAGVSKNVFRRIKSERGYYGPDLKACIRIGLAIGCDNIADIDRILLARDLEPLTYGRSRKYKKYRRIVRIILKEEELPPKDRALIFKICVG